MGIPRIGPPKPPWGRVRDGLVEHLYDEYCARSEGEERSDMVLELLYRAPLRLLRELASEHDDGENDWWRH